MNNAATFKVTTPSDREIVMSRVFDAPRKRVFEAWTNPKIVPLWLLGPDGWTMPVCEIELRPGGSWHFVWRKADGAQMEMRGVYKMVKPPEKLVSTESWGGEWPETLNTLEFTEEKGKTTLTHTALYPSREDRDKALQTGMTKGVTRSFDRLEDLLASKGGFAAEA